MVFAVDISPALIEHVSERVRANGWDNVETVLCTDRSAELPPDSVDLVFVCDTYHHFEYPRTTLASLHDAIAPGGRLVIVEFERVPGQSRQWVLDHVRAGRETFTEEIESAGFELIGELPVDGLSENYVLSFRRP
jgi:SAM-dependent methyltransferase